MNIATPQDWSHILEDAQFRKQLVDAGIPAYLQSKRWFGAKSARVKKYEIESHLRYETDGRLVHLLLVEVIFITSNSDTYFVPLSFETGEVAEPEGKVLEAEVGGIQGWLVDALYVAAFRDSLFTCIATDRVLNVVDGLMIMDHGRGLTWQPGQDLHSRLLNIEQSNTTIVFNERYFLKIYRKLYRGQNPDYEVSRFLTEKTDFRYTPAYCGAINWSRSEAYKVTLGLMQRKVENQGDAWPFFLQQVEGYFSRLEAGGHPVDTLEKIPLYEPLAAEDLPVPFWDLIGEEALARTELLAQRTAELHLALFWERTETAFTSIPYSEDYKVWLLNRILYMLDHRITTMESILETLSPKARTYAEEFLARKSEVKSRIVNFDDRALNGARIRIHGDYHLGQVLLSDNDYVILDFEGEPEATIRDRKVKHSPLKDVAGMCRSFHYAVYATIFSQHAYQLSENELMEAGGRYYRAIVAVFLHTYLNTAYENGLSIGYKKEIDFLLRYHIFEKAIYELGYELNSRPDWVVIPLKGLNQILNND
ncbi:MAG: trehalose synthase [Bacteroidota bacterium]